MARISYDEYDERLATIVRELKRKPTTPAELEKQMGLSKRTIYRYLSDIDDDVGNLVRRNVNGQTFYQLASTV